MSKKNREQRELVPEELQHDPITMPEPIVLQSGDSVETDIHITVPPDGPTTVRTTFGRVTVAPHPTGQTEIKTMAERQTAKVVQQIFRCVYDDQALARMLTVGERDPDIFCPVCGNRMVRER